MSEIKWTDEQLNLFEHARCLNSIAAIAVAGSGKTSVLVELGRRFRKRAIYLAFNRRVALDAKRRLPSHIHCTTWHSFAFHNLSIPLQSKVLRCRAPRITDFTEAMCIAGQNYASYDYHTIRQGLDVLEAFSNSSDLDVCSSHAKASTRQEQEHTVLECARTIWKLAFSARSSVPILRNWFLKYYALGRPVLLFDLCLLDEAQDSNPACVELLDSWACQKIIVGDPAQAIYGWRGTQDALRKIGVDVSLTLSQSFRFGKYVEELANPLLAVLGEDFRVVANPKKSTRQLRRASGVRIYRTRASMILRALKSLENGRPVSVIGSLDLLKEFVSEVEMLQRGRADWGGVFGASNWDDARCQTGAVKRALATYVDSKGLEWVRKSLADVRSGNQEYTEVLSTLHASKGAEYPVVSIGNDYHPRTYKRFGSTWYEPEEARILYTALTRCKDGLFVPKSVIQRFDI